MSGSIIEFFDNYWFGIGVFLLAIFVSLHEARIKGESGLQFLVRLPGNLIACFFVSLGGYVMPGHHRIRKEEDQEKMKGFHQTQDSKKRRPVH